MSRDEFLNDPRRRKYSKKSPSVSVPKAREGVLVYALKVLIEVAVIVLLGVALALALGFTYRRLTEQAFFPLKRVIVNPLRYGDNQALLQAVKAHASSADLLLLDVNQLSRDLEKLSWVASVQVSKHWPDALYIDVKERQPVLRWSNTGYLDKDGHLFQVHHPITEHLFSVLGPDGYEEDVLRHYRVIEPWLMAQGVPIERLRLDPRLIWHVLLPGGIDVVLGRENLGDRLKKLVLVYRKVIVPYGAYIQRVDLRYQSGFSVHWKAGVTPSTPEEGTK